VLTALAFIKQNRVCVTQYSVPALVNFPLVLYQKKTARLERKTSLRRHIIETGYVVKEKPLFVSFDMLQWYLLNSFPFSDQLLS